MACTNTVKPNTVERPTSIYGAPQGQAGRTFNGNDFGIQAIILHCTDMTISQYVQYIACLTQPVLNTSDETTHHYSIGSSGALNQHIDDANISWTFGAYAAAQYPTAPTPTRTITWQTLQDLNGVNVSPDVYAINIVVAKSYNQGTACLTSSGLPADQHDKLLQLLAYLTETYNIPIDADHIQWHDNIATQACPSNECNCTDIACLIRDINSYCETDDCNNITYSQVDCNQVSSLLAIPDACANSSGCIVSVPFDACCFGHLPIGGEIEQFVGLALDNTTDKLCLVKNSISVTAPLTGDGTAANPLTLDRCLFGDFVPDGDPVTVLGIDVAGCLVETALSSVVPGLETPLTVIDTSTIDLTAGGTNGHELTASVKLSTATGNLLTADGTGLFFALTCEQVTDLFGASTGIVNFIGVDGSGNCISEGFEQAVDNAICNTGISDGVLPMHVLGRDIDLNCPVFFTPVQVVTAGLDVDDTTTIDLTMELSPGVSPLNVITGEVRIDPATDNVIQVTSEGLYVAPIQAQAGDTCLDVQAVNGLITISHIIDSKAENILQCGPDGLCVLDLVPEDSDCFEFLYDTTTRELSGRIILAPDQNNISNVAQCIPGEGFYVARGANLLANGPLTGDGSEISPLDIDFAALDNEDLCDLGGAIPEALSLVNVIGTDSNDCLRLYTGEQFIAQFLEIDNGDCITATLTDNVLSIEPRISAAIGGFNNVLSCTSTGMYVPIGAGISVVNTNCIELQFVNGVLTSTIILDPSSENQITCNVDGLFVPRGGGVVGGLTDCIGVQVVDGIVTATPIISGSILGINNIITCEPGGLFVPVGAGITAQSTDCITVTLADDGTLTVDPIISPLIGNVLECTANGLYVPDTTDFIQSVSSTDCIALSVIGGQLTATPIIDPSTSNLLSCGTNGLLVALQATASNCIDLTLTNGVLSASPIIDPDANNLLTCGTNGLLVELDGSLFDDTDCIEITETNGVITIDPILSPDIGALTNVLQCTENGLYVPAAAGLAVLDGTCIELTLANEVLTADIVIDPEDDNQVVCTQDGLYVPTGAGLQVEDTDCVNLNTNVNGVLSAVLTLAPAQSGVTNSITCVAGQGLFVPQAFITAITDTQCMNLSVVNGALSVAPIVSTTAGNLLQCTASGLYVSPLTAVDSSCIDVDITNNVLTINPIISPLADNLLTCQGDGLYVPQLVAVDSNCLDIEITNGTITVNPIISATANNALQCLADGFYVEECCPLVEDTNSINLTLIASRTITADLIVDPDPTNALEVTANGVYVPEDFILSVNDTPCMDLDVTGGVLTATPIIDPAADNALTCGPAGLYAPTLTAVDGNCVDLEVANNVLTAEIIISGQAENAVNCLADGLFVQDCCPLVLDTLTVDLTLNGIRTISADVNIDTDVNNQLVVNPDGLFVAPPLITAIADHQCIDLDATNGVLTATPLISATADNQFQCIADGFYVPQAAGLEVLDTPCFDFTIVNGVLTGAPILSDNIDNVLTCEADGLYVPRGADLQVVDTNCINLTLATGVLSADPIISPLAANTLVCQGDGLYVPQLLTLDTNCINLDITGNVLSANPILSVTADNALTCIGDGLYVPQGANLTPLDTDCIDIDITNGIISAELTLAPTQGTTPNVIQCIPGQGLYVPQGVGMVVIDTNCIDLTLTDGILTADVIIDPDVCNAVECRADGLFAPTHAYTRTIGTALSGANEIEIDTNCDGVADFEFCEGICEIVSTNDCTGGIGADYQVNEFAINGSTLTINSQRVPTHIAGGPTNAFFLEIPVADGAWVDLVGLGQFQSIFAEDPCYDMVVNSTYTMSILGDMPANTQLEVRIFHALDGADSVANSATAVFVTQGAPEEVGQALTTLWPVFMTAGGGTRSLDYRVQARILPGGTPIGAGQIVLLQRIVFTGVPV